MLKKLELQNYRCYEKHEFPFKELAIVVGRNNAGKSTLIEAIRLVSLVIEKLRTKPFKDPPDWYEFPYIQKGIYPSLKLIGFSSKSLFYQYGDPPATIRAYFSNDIKIEISIGPEESLFASIWDADGCLITSKDKVIKSNLSYINVLPQISPIQTEERLLSEDYVKSSLSRLASLHFRNQLQYYQEFYKKFKELSENTWPGLKIESFEKGDLVNDNNPALLVRENNFTAEIGWMGHGLQMWLQTMWFLSRVDAKSTIVLDEPDVYMHADLQKRLIRIVKNKFNQVIIATHSVEIMSEVEPDNILVIDRNLPKSIYASTFPAVQRIVDHIGSIHNIQLARLWSSNKILIVEGDDIQILKRFQDTLYENSDEPFDVVPSFSIGGWGGWNYAIGSKMLLKNAGNHSIAIYCILDSDYHSEDEKKKRYKDAKDRGIFLHIWQKKELENYLLIPSAIHRLINKGKKTSKVITIDAIKTKLNSFADEMKLSVIDKIAEEFQLKDKSQGVSVVNKKAREQVDRLWSDKLSVVSGKEILKKIRKWAADEYGVSFSDAKLTKAIRLDEINEEMRNLIEKIERCKPIF